MYDRRSRFNPSPSPPTLPPPSNSATTNSSITRPVPCNTDIYLRSPRVIPQRKISDIQSHVKHQFARQKRKRALIWLSEAQMTRQLTRNVWKLQTREERLVLDLNVVRAVIGDMLREIDQIEERDVGGDDNDDQKWNENHSNIRQNLLDRFARSRIKPTSKFSPILSRSDEQITAARSHLLIWQTFIAKHLHRACEAVIMNSRTTIPPTDEDDLNPVEHAYEVLSQVLAIRPTRADKAWFADLPSLGETAAFGGLRGLPDARVKAVVWHVAEVYAAFMTEKRVGRRIKGERTETWVEIMIETGEALRDGLLYEEVGVCDDAPATGAEDMVDTEVLGLCESFDQMRLVEVGSDGVLASSRRRQKRSKVSRSSSSLLREKIEKLWVKGTGYVKEEFCTSS